MRIEAAVVSSPSFTVPTVMLVGGLGGNDESARLVEQELRRWEGLSQGRRFHLIVIALANPGAQRLEFPPTGVAYRENVVSHVLWRWIGIHAPDLVIVAGNEDSGLADALSGNSVAGVGRIPARRMDVKEGILQSLPRDIPPSEAHREIDRRLRRTARELAAELAEVYGHDFDQPIYMPGMGVIGQLRSAVYQRGEKSASRNQRPDAGRPSCIRRAGRTYRKLALHRTGAKGGRSWIQRGRRDEGVDAVPQ